MFSIEEDWPILNQAIDAYLLDILAYPNLSQAIADDFDVFHASPQLLLIEGGECTFEAEHLEINLLEVKAHLAH